MISNFLKENHFPKYDKIGTWIKNSTLEHKNSNTCSSALGSGARTLASEAESIEAGSKTQQIGLGPLKLGLRHRCLCLENQA